MSQRIVFCLEMRYAFTIRLLPRFDVDDLRQRWQILLTSWGCRPPYSRHQTHQSRKYAARLIAGTTDRGAAQHAWCSSGFWFGWWLRHAGFQTTSPQTRKPRNAMYDNSLSLCVQRAPARHQEPQPEFRG